MNSTATASATFPKAAIHGKDHQPETRNVVQLRPTAGAAPNSLFGKVSPPRRVPNREIRTREHLTPDEVEKLMTAAGRLGRHGHRDATLILITYRHALRVGELVSLRWDQVDLTQGLLHVARLKNGSPSTHPLRGPEIRALRRLRRDYPDTPYVFCSERRGPMTTSNVRKLIARAGGSGWHRFPGPSAHVASCDRLQARERRV